MAKIQNDYNTWTIVIDYNKNKIAGHSPEGVSKKTHMVEKMHRFYQVVNGEHKRITFKCYSQIVNAPGNFEFQI